jgi:hypothetical protein
VAGRSIVPGASRTIARIATSVPPCARARG